MEQVNYWQSVRELSARNDEALKALEAFLANNPRPSGVKLLEYDQLALAYVKAFNEWIAFCEKNLGTR
ncbi:hypothetical protein [Pseudomonas mosselii]|uniref:hypothetical protein n=1 Tax=Pseudomonas mosselii TaxID=78327 RepID=UPI0021A8790D|nr:hypothetical protein [Pseudomonas mosselii]UWS65413.1 hypothetical protein N0U38_16640 [Pseudomonas mosselii]